MQLLVLLKAGGRHIRSADAWKAVFAMIVPASLHPGASPAAFDALAVAASRDVLTAVSFRPCLDAAVTIIERHSKARPSRSADTSSDNLQQGSFDKVSASEVGISNHSTWQTRAFTLC